MLDFILYLIVIFFIFNRLFSILGAEDEESRERSRKYTRFFTDTISNSKNAFVNKTVRVMKKVSATSISASEAGLCADSRDALRNLQKKDSTFDLDGFVDKAARAFCMTYPLPSEEEQDVLKALLTDDVYEELQSLKNSQHEVVRQILKIRDHEPTLIEEQNNTFVITMKIISDQKHFVKNKDGILLTGSESKAIRVVNVCKFVRNFDKKVSQEQGKIWMISSINSI